MKSCLTLVVVVTLLLVSNLIHAQGVQYKIASVGFYNLENLFDTENDTTIWDEEFLPEGGKSWTIDRYNEKQANMAYVISQMGIDKAPQGLSVLGVCEIENRKVLEDLVAQTSIADRGYEIVHIDSKDGRGIDVGLLYNPDHFEVSTYRVYDMPIYRDSVRKYTRDVLYVKGALDGDTMHFLVNHWPSRRGGASRTNPLRVRAAQVNKHVIDSIVAIDPAAKIIVMGDLNDNPTDDSVKGILRGKQSPKKVKDGDMYNPMMDYYRRGMGSNAYRDVWSLFDQMLFTPGFLDKQQDGYFYYKSNIFNKKFLVQRRGRYKGYPFRTYSGGTYQGGYSDHYPVYTLLLKAAE